MSARAAQRARAQRSSSNCSPWAAESELRSLAKKRNGAQARHGMSRRMAEPTASKAGTRLRPSTTKPGYLRPKPSHVSACRAIARDAGDDVIKGATTDALTVDAFPRSEPSRPRAFLRSEPLVEPRASRSAALAMMSRGAAGQSSTRTMTRYRAGHEPRFTKDASRRSSARADNHLGAGGVAYP